MSSAGSSLGGLFWKHREAASRTASTTASTGNSAAQANSPSVRELPDACKSTPDQAEMRNGETGSEVAIGVRYRERTREFEERQESMGPRAGGKPSIDRGTRRRPLCSRVVGAAGQDRHVTPAVGRSGGGAGDRLLVECRNWQTRLARSRFLLSDPIIHRFTAT
jgi:hypothetical protein